MNLWCPNCTQPLIVPEQVAGQPMHCPLCASAPSPRPPPPRTPAAAQAIQALPTHTKGRFFTVRIANSPEESWDISTL